MAINLNQLIAITANTLTNGFNPAALVSNLLSKNQLIPNNATQRCIKFASPDMVGEYFGYTSEEYFYAVQYFLGYNGQQTTAPFFWISRYIDEAVGAYIHSNIVLTGQLGEFKKITAGTMKFRFNDEEQLVTNLDFSLANSLSDVANILQIALINELPNATVSYSSLSHAFTVKLSTLLTDQPSTVDFCPESVLATLFRFTEAQNAVLSQGSLGQTPIENMNSIRKITRNWENFHTLWDNFNDVDEAVQLGKWNTANTERTIYSAWTATSVTHAIYIQQQMVLNNCSNVAVFFSKLDFVASVAGMYGAINYSSRNATLALANKNFANIIPLVDNDSDYIILNENHINYYGRFASRSNIYNFSEDGSITGEWKFIENIYNEAALETYLQDSIAEFFAISKNNPYTIDGYAALSTIIEEGMQKFVYNGVAQPNVSISQSQSQALLRDAGYNISQTLFNQGYVYQVVPATPEERQTRAPVVVKIWYTNGGSFNRVIIQSTFIQ